MEQQPALTVRASKKDIIDFFDSFLIYNGNRIFYKDFEGVSYLYTQTSHSINFIPVGTSHSYSVGFAANGSKYKIKISTKNNYDAFAKICVAFKTTVNKFILVNLLIKYGEEGGLEIGGLKINSQGLFKKKFFGTEILPWNQFFNCTNESGCAYVFKKANNKQGYKQFFACSTLSTNGPILSDLLVLLFQFNGVVDKESLFELKKQKEEMSVISESPEPLKEYCKECGEEIVAEKQKFCGKCGYKLA